ncbi:MAG: HAMP domain-containing protein [Sedimentisphaerales bacterium]|nr:HAMP domain-containing protein [Sedimentisphaerales bacterium]
MIRQRLLWHLFVSYLLIILAAVIGICLYGTSALRTFYRAQVEEDLEARAHLVAPQVLEQIRAGDRDRLDALCKQWGRASHTRITVVLAGGEVIGDSDADVRGMENHADRPEIQKALQTGKGSNVRPSDTLKQAMMYFALALPADDQAAVLVRTSVRVTDIDEALARINRRILWAGVVVALGAAGLSLLMSRRISRPIEQMKEAAQRYAAGDLSGRVPGAQTAELDALADTLNQMARQLQQRFQTVTEQRNELEAMLSSMVEGVLAVDEVGRVLSVNEAACRLLDVAAEDAVGRVVQEVVRNPDLQEFVGKALFSDATEEMEIVLSRGGTQRYFQLHGTSLTNDRGDRCGAVIVLNDMTRIRRLEDMRRDFVANVSHELKTPVTSIKGFVDTLLEGGLEDPQEARRFLEIIGQQSDRLNGIIEDILDLSRIEQYGRERALALRTEPLRPVLAGALELCRPLAEAKNIRLDLQCEPDLEARIHAAFLEQAVVNLVNNAVTYSDANGAVRVSARRQEDQFLISVSDDGLGIAPEQLPRIFERFYVADKEQGRKRGSTGLGLAIVKHIAQAHGGQVTVESAPGKGSTFTIYIPAAEA